MRKTTQRTLIGALALALIVSMASLASAAKPGRDAGAKMRGSFGTPSAGARGGYVAPAPSTGAYESYYRGSVQRSYVVPQQRVRPMWRFFRR